MVSPVDRYYYGWYDSPPPEFPPTDREIKSDIVDRLRNNPHAKDDYIQSMSPKGSWSSVAGSSPP